MRIAKLPDHCASCTRILVVSYTAQVSNRCSDDRAVDAGRWVAVIVPSSTLLLEIHEKPSNYPTKQLKNRRSEIIFILTKTDWWHAAGCAVGWGTALQAERSRGPFPDGVIGIFHWHNPSGCTMALGLTQPLTQMSTRNISWGGKGGRCVGLTTLPSSCADCIEIWEPQTPGTLRACPGL